MDDFFGVGGAGEAPLTEKKRKRAFSMSKSLFRETFDFGHFDYQVLKPVPGLATLYNKKKAISLAAFRIVRLCFAVATLVIVMTQTMETTPPERVEVLGFVAWRVLGNFARFLPVPFIFTAIQQYNNHYSERIYYKYLQRGAIVDFPETGNRRYMFKMWGPRIFLGYYLFNLVFNLSVMLILQAPIGKILIFCNVMASVLIFWKRNQSLEVTLISLTNFIQAFKDADGQYLNIDDVSLTSAAHCLTKITLIECPEPSYSSYLRKQYWKLANFSTSLRWGLRVSVYFMLLLWAGLTVYYGFERSDTVTARVWRQTINPCLAACYDTTEQMVDPQHFDTTSTLKLCYCKCINDLSLYGYHRTCSDYIAGVSQNKESVCECGRSE